MPSTENVVNLLGLAEECQKRHLHFALYRLPGEKQRHMVLQQGHDLNTIGKNDSLIAEKGFAFLPFAGSEMPGVLIKQDFLLTDDEISEEALIGILRKVGFSKNGFQRQHPHYTTKEEYCEEVESVISEIRQGVLKKAVLSRAYEYRVEDEFSSVAFFTQLEKLYPNAFVYLVNLPHTGLWIGASPELLVEVQNDTLRTVSLAGTKKIEVADDFDWGTKELQEQKLVTDYIRGCLQKYFDDAVEIQGPETVKAGPLEHLKTTFKVKSTKKEIETVFDKLLADLQPTPAVAGIPKQEALELIKNLENYDRSYYSGFLGPVNMNDSTNLFVNLRCLEVLRDGLVLYVGAGITEDSDPDAEWEETQLKAKTLLNAL